MKVDDRRYHKRQLEDAQAKVEQLDEMLKLAIRELDDDDHDVSENARARLAEARTHAQLAAGSIERALEQLPTPSTQWVRQLKGSLGG